MVYVRRLFTLSASLEYEQEISEYIQAGKTEQGSDEAMCHDADLSFLFRRFTRSTILRCSSVSFTSLLNSGVDSSAFASVSEFSSNGSSKTFRLRGESLDVRCRRAGAEAAILSDFTVRFLGLGLELGLGDAPAGRPYVAKDLRSAVNNTF